MAEGKKSFVAYVDWKETFDALPDDKAGQLVKHLFSYVNDENPVTDDIIIKAVFANIKQQLKRDLRKWESTSQIRSEIGKKGGIKSGESRRSKQTKQKVKNRSKTKQNEHVTVTVNGTVNDTVINEEKKLPDKPADFIDQIVNCFIQEHGSYEIVTPGREREMAGRILKVYKNKYPDASSEETLNGLRSYFKMCVNIQDSWLRNNMSLSIIVSKFNEINKILKNGTNKISGATNEQIAGLLADKLGVIK